VMLADPVVVTSAELEEVADAVKELEVSSSQSSSPSETVAEVVEMALEVVVKET